MPITAGTFVADATGRITLTGVTDGDLLAPLNLQLYVDGNGNAMALTMDTTDITEGPGYQQTTGGTFGAGAYVMATTGLDGTNEIEFDAVGPIVSDGTATFTGFADLNWLSDGTGCSTDCQLASRWCIYRSLGRRLYRGRQHDHRLGCHDAHGRRRLRLLHR